MLHVVNEALDDQIARGFRLFLSLLPSHGPLDFTDLTLERFEMN